MINLNLLPDIKMDYLRAQRTKRFFITASFLVSAATIGAVVLMAFFVYVIQGGHSSNLKNDIISSVATLQEEPDLQKVLTVQKQLETLPGLHEDSPVISRLFNYLTVLVPDEVGLDNFEFIVSEDGREISIELNGRSSDFKAVNVFADSLKNAEFTSANVKEPMLAFSAVILDNIGTSSDETVFKITSTVESLIFDAREDTIKLIVPNITSSQSAQDRPTQLFSQPATEDVEAQ